MGPDTIRNAAKAARYKIPDASDRKPWIGKCEVTAIANARKKKVFKRGEKEAFEALIERIDAPKIGFQTRAKAKSNPKMG